MKAKQSIDALPEPKPEPETKPRRRLRIGLKRKPVVEHEPPQQESSVLFGEKEAKRQMKSLSRDAETNIDKILKSPEQYIEINMIRKRRIVDTFFIFADKKTFKYRNLVYEIVEDVVYLIPKKGGFFVATCYYKEGKRQPVNFKQNNKGITGKAMTLLYKTKLYQALLPPEKNTINIIIVLLLIATMILFGAGLWLLLQPQTPPELALPAVIFWGW